MTYLFKTRTQEDFLYSFIQFAIVVSCISREEGVSNLATFSNLCVCVCVCVCM